MTNNIKKNNNLSISNIDENINLANVQGDYKLILGDYNIIKETLKISNNTSINKLKEHFKGRYNDETIEKFINALLEEELLENSNEKITEEKKDIVVIKKGIIYDNLKPHLNKYLSIKKEISFSPDKIDYSFDASLTLVVLSDATWADALDLNRKLYNSGTPYLFCYFDGNTVVLGPLVIPWKTVCLECIATHHLNQLSNKINYKIDIEYFEKLNISYDLDSNVYSEVEFASIANNLLTAINNLGVPGSVHDLIGTEVRYESKKILSNNMSTYTPISTCKCCHAYNKNYFFFNKELPNIPIDIVSKNTEKSQINYSTAGMRALTKTETKDLLNRALNKTGIGIEIKLNTSNVFKDIIPVYDSYLKETHENNLNRVLDKQVSHGKGINKEQAYFSAGFEIFERISARYFGEKNIISATPEEVMGKAIDVSKLSKSIINHNTPFDKFNYKEKVDWVWGTSLINGEHKLIPASMVFFSNVVFQGNFFPLSSSGLAAGGTLKDAILQGLFELLEHDAWIMGQSIPSKLPILDFSKSTNTELLNKVEEIKNKGFDIITRDYTNDLGIPVFRTWIVNKNDYSSYATNGFGASFDPEIALERSITEAVQSASGEDLVKTQKYERGKADYLSNSPASVYNLNYFIHKDIKASESDKIVSIDSYKNGNFSNVNEIIEHILKKVKKQIPDIDILFVDLTREEIGIPVVRMIAVGGLQNVGLPMLSVSERTFTQGKQRLDIETINYEDLYMGIYPH